MFLAAWKIPINVTQESYDRIRNNPVHVKRKRPRPNLPDFIDQENTDLSTADIIITNINPPSIEYRPCVMLSGFGLAKEEQRVCSISFFGYFKIIQFTNCLSNQLCMVHIFFF